MKKLIVCSLISVVLLAGCNANKPIPRELVFVPDISASIDPAAERQMFTAIEEVAQHLRRRDTLTIIPITGNAEAELQGQILHYEVAPIEQREAYDTDLRKVNAQIKGDLARLQADAIAHPGKHTDILGSIRVAMSEFSDRATEKRLIVLSDFIQDDAQFNFRKDTPITVLISTKTMPARPRVAIFLGRLRSEEFSSLPIRRQRAIDNFWRGLMIPAEVQADGTSGIGKFLHQ